MKQDKLSLNISGDLVPADDFLIVELDDRLEFGTPVPQNGTACNPKINFYMCK
jgi:hypothetical protein